MNGVDADFRAISDDQRLLDMQAAISHGNHESAVTHHDVLSSNFSKEIRTGFQLHVDIEDMLKIKGAEVAPVGVATQDAID